MESPSTSTPSRQRTLRLTPKSRRLIAGETYEVSFSLRKGALPFVAGQYVRLTIRDVADPRGNARDFSIASAPSDKMISIATRDTGSAFKKALLYQENVTVEIDGPFGTFTLPEDASHPLIFIAGGVGITPLRSMIRFMVAEELPYTVHLLYANRDRESAAYLDELIQLAELHPNFTMHAHFGALDESTLDALENIGQASIFISGPPGMVVKTRRAIMGRGAPAKRISTEEFTGYDGVELAYEQANRTLGTQSIKSLGAGIEGELGERSLSDLEALLEALNNTAIVSETNAQGTITFVNDKFVEISKYSRDELIGQNHRILKSGFHSKAFYENLWATIVRGRLWRGQIKNKAKDGSYYWVDTSIAPILDGGGKPIKYISVRFPITERQQAEEELKERAKQQDVLTKLSQAALASTNLTELFEQTVDLLALSFTIEYCAILKYHPDRKELTYEAGVGFRHTKPGVTTMPADTTLSMAGFTLAAREPVLVEDLASESRFVGSRLLHDEGVASGISVIIHGQDYPFGILEMYTRTKRTFTKDDSNFVQAVANLLANAARNQLDKRKDEFLGIASHELKTPLTTIKTFTQLLQHRASRSSDTESALALSRIDSQITKLTELIGSLLDISRINAGKLEYKDERFAIADIVRELVEEQQMTTPKHRLIVENHASKLIYGDQYRIGQVLTNLITNAVKYSPESEKIIIRTKDIPDGVLVSVKDFGVGIPKDEQPHVFDRFFRGTDNQRRFLGGLGLGLYISAEIVKRHKGRLWVESENGRGSTFLMLLPNR